MCGIVGAIINENCVPVLLQGLSKLEYRGYDSAGIAVGESENEIKIIKSEGKLQRLFEKIEANGAPCGSCGIGHTRWATHGEPSEKNAHPHYSDGNTVVGVHNGIIENYTELKSRLFRNGYTFYSSTDTEVVIKLIDYCYKKSGRNPIFAIRDSIMSIKGSYALEIIFNDHPDKIFLARKDSPLIVGIGQNGSYIASDVPALLDHTDSVYYMENMEIGEISMGKADFYNIEGEKIQKSPSRINWRPDEACLGEYKHFMIKEIFEQPSTVKRTVSSYFKDEKIDFSDYGITEEMLKSIRSIKIIGCGSAYHVGAIGQYIIERYARIPVKAELASEFRYKAPIYSENELVIAISQSGETADTLFALRDARYFGASTLAIVNVMGSSIAREADKVLYTFAGPEIAVATTKAFTAQISVLCLIAAELSRVNSTISVNEYDSLIKNIKDLPSIIESIFTEKNRIKEIASKLSSISDAYFIGRGIDYAICLEGSLKMKEISYVHSEAYAAGELKHGTISLIECGTPVIGVVTQKNVYDKTLSNLAEVKARGATVIALSPFDISSDMEHIDFDIKIPSAHEMLSPIIASVPLQLLAYYMSVERGLDVDKPRNLAKSVTVE